MLRDLGHMIAVSATINLQTVGASENVSINGTGVDRLGYESLVFAFQNSKPSGVPLQTTITFAAEESSDDSTYTAISGITSTHNVTNTVSNVELSIPDATGLKRYVRGTCVSSFNGGSGVYALVGGLVIKGSPKEYPV